MARLPRIDIPGYPQHLMVRGNNRCDLFTCDLERYQFLSCLQHGLAKFACELHAFVLMTNHVHLLATGREKGAISDMLQAIGSRFVPFVNGRRSRTGTLFEGRFKSSLVETDRYFLTCMRYIELNPVRAGMVAHPSEHAWSSFLANHSGAPIPPLTPHPTYLALGKSAADRGNAYLQLFESPITDEDLAAIRRSLRESRVLGGLEFEKQVLEEVGRVVAPGTHGGKRTGQARAAVKGSAVKGSEVNLTP